MSSQSVYVTTRTHAQGIDATPINYTDTVYTHRPGFFDTVLAQAYVGYGASSLGLASEGEPRPCDGLQLLPGLRRLRLNTRDAGHLPRECRPLPGAT